MFFATMDKPQGVIFKKKTICVQKMFFSQRWTDLRAKFMKEKRFEQKIFFSAVDRTQGKISERIVIFEQKPFFGTVDRTQGDFF